MVIAFFETNPKLRRTNLKNEVPKQRCIPSFNTSIVSYLVPTTGGGGGINIPELPILPFPTGKPEKSNV